MNAAEYIRTSGLTFGPPKAVDGERASVRASLGGRHVDLPLTVGEGKSYAPEAFLLVLRDSFRTLRDVERSDGSDFAESRARYGALPPEAQESFLTLRDTFRDVVGPDLFARLLDDVD